MLALATIYVSARHCEDVLVNQITRQDVPKMRELSRLFSEFSTNHVKFISLLTGSLKGKAEEGQFYAHGRKNILAVNKTISALEKLGNNFELNAQQRQIAGLLREKLILYRDRMGESVLMSSVQIGLIPCPGAGRDPALHCTCGQQTSVDLAQNPQERGCHLVA